MAVIWWILLLDITSPVFSLIHAVLGEGTPEALHESVTLSPSVTGAGHRWMVTLGSSTRKVNDERYYCYYHVRDSNHWFVKVALFLPKLRFINLSHEQCVDRSGLHALVVQCGEYYARCDWSLPKIYLTNRFHVAVRLFSNRSQMTSKCGKNKVVVHEPQASFTTFWRHLWSVTEQTHGNLFVLYNDHSDTHTCLVPLDCSKICASLGIFSSPKGYISSLLLPFFLILLVYSFFEKFFNVSSCSKQNNGENILQNSESLVAMAHDGDCCEDFL